jgi:site-specific DNA recombinase
MTKSPSQPITEPKSVGIWIRVSTEDQVKGESPEHHLDRARAYAKVRGWEVKEVYDLAGLKGWSGKTVKDHPEAKRMLGDIKRGHITGLIFSKLARLARNTKELLEFADYFREHRADLISIAETIDTSSPAGRLFFTIIAAMAQWEREEIADRIRASVTTRAKLGKPLSGVAPYGYHWKDKQLVLNPEQAPVRKLIYELFLQHRRKGFVARKLNEAGYRTSTGAQWSDMGIGRILRCPSAKGVYCINRMRQTGSWTWEDKPESEWGVLKIEPIVSESLWDQCNQILEEQQKKAKRVGKKPVQLFAGLTVCACGQRMYVKVNSPKYVCEKCHNKIPIIDLEAVVHEEFKAFFFAEPERVAVHLKQAHQNLLDKETLLQIQQKEVQKVRDEMDRTHRLYIEGQITSQGFGQYYKPAEQHLNQMLAELPKLEAEVAYLKVANVSVEEVTSEAERLYTQWPTLSGEAKRSILEAIIEKITVGQGEIDISLYYLPSSEELIKNQQVLPPRSAPARPPPSSRPGAAPEAARPRRECPAPWADRNSGPPSSRRPAPG